MWQRATGYKHISMGTYLGVQASIGLEWLKQVMQALIVDLNIAHADPAVLSVILASKLQSLGKQVSQGTWYETSIVNISICMATLSYYLDCCRLAAANQTCLGYIIAYISICTVKMSMDDLWKHAGEVLKPLMGITTADIHRFSKSICQRD